MRPIALVTLLIALLPAEASAFCGFYVASTDRELFNHATIVVLLRDGNTTFLSMQNDYQGPPQDFAMVVPVPVVLREEQVRTLPKDVFERVERMAAPRLVEYWEQDPCQPESPIGLGNLGTIGFGGGGGTGSGYGRGGGVVVEARFAVGEYDIVILSAQDSTGLDEWLRDNGYRIPAGAEEALRPYVESGMKFFVAKVDVGRVTFEDGRAVLSPLRVQYQSDELSLPVRLGLLNSEGTQDLIVHVLGRRRRYEVSSYPNVFIPTNIDVRPEARARFGEFYAALFDRTLERNPGAVVTEYAWSAGSCDPCPGDIQITEEDLVTLGAGQAQAEEEEPAPVPGGVPVVRLGTPAVTGPIPPEMVRRILRRHINEIRFCHERALNTSPGLAGRVVLTLAIDAGGRVTESTVGSSTLGNQGVEQCIAGAGRRWTFPAPNGGVPVRVQIPITLTLGPGGGGGWGFGSSLLSEFVLTRLHYRYGRDGLGHDLIFREAEPVVGGRENRDPEGHLEEGALPADTNNFQARYAIRHPWEGPIECEAPVRGRWGGPPEGTPPPGTAAATGIGNVPRGGIQLPPLLAQNVPALGITGIAATQVQAQPPLPERQTSNPETPATPSTPAAPPSADAGGCGCAAAAGPGGSAGWLLLAISVPAALARRRASPPRRRRRSARS